MSLADQKLDTMPAGAAAFLFGVDAAGLPVLTTAGDTLLDGNNVAASLTGTTAETVLATINLPALLENDVLRVESLWSSPGGNANNKTFRLRLGGIAGTQFMSITNTTQLSMWEIRSIANRNSKSSQIGRATAAGIGASTGAVVTSAVDTSVSTTLVLTGQLANAADSIVLERYLVELLRR